MKLDCIAGTFSEYEITQICGKSTGAGICFKGLGQSGMNILEIFS
jgi:hypothetical protein